MGKLRKFLRNGGTLCDDLVPVALHEVARFESGKHALTVEQLEHLGHQGVDAPSCALLAARGHDGDDDDDGKGDHDECEAG